MKNHRSAMKPSRLVILIVLMLVVVWSNGWGAWYSPSWSYRKTITIDYTKVAETVSNFPVLINLASDAGLAANAQSSGNDILFTSSDGRTKLSHEIESYTSATGALIAHVKVPSVSSAANTVIYMYYGNAAATNQQSAAAVWSNGFVMVQHMASSPAGTASTQMDSLGVMNGTSRGTMAAGALAGNKIGNGLTFDGSNDSLTFYRGTLWPKSASNPLITGQFGSIWYNGIGDYHAYYSDGTNALHATSSDGITWTPDAVNNPVMTPGAVGQWDAGSIQTVQVWKEGTTWYMLYGGKPAGNERKVGLATSSDGLSWTKSGSNPVLAASAATWEVSDGLGLDPWGIIKVGSTYYLWYNTVNATTSTTRATGLATSTDLVNWTKDTANNPIFQTGRYCVTPFKYGSYYYMLVPLYYNSTNGFIELYRDTAPTFYPASREYLGNVVANGVANVDWDDTYFDTPSVLTVNINRNTFPDSTNVLMYYTGLKGAAYTMGLAQTTLASLPNLSVMPATSPLDVTTGVSVELWSWITTANATYSLLAHKQNAYGFGLHKSGSNLFPMMELKTDNSWRYTTDSTTNVTAGAYHYLAATYDAASHTVSYFVDGAAAQTDTTNGSGNIATSAFSFQSEGIGSLYAGKIDELRVSNSARSVGWFATTYANQNDPATFYGLSDQMYKFDPGGWILGGGMMLKGVGR